MCKRWLAALVLLVPVVASAGSAWSPVPGAPQWELDLASVARDGQVVWAWVRGTGRDAPLLDAPLAKGAVWRNVVRAQVDCVAGSVRPLAAIAYAPSGAILDARPLPAMRAVPLEGATLWLRDTLCEAARAAG
jgi:hypothetical protein